jgi:hypothetical protein
VLERIPTRKLPDRLRKPLENLKSQLDEFFDSAAGAGGKAADGSGNATRGTIQEQPQPSQQQQGRGA